MIIGAAKPLNFQVPMLLLVESENLFHSILIKEFCFYDNLKAVRYDLLKVESHFWVLCFLWLFDWADGINKCGWCLAGGRGC